MKGKIHRGYNQAVLDIAMSSFAMNANGHVLCNTGFTSASPAPLRETNPVYDLDGQQKSAKGKAPQQPDRDFEACARLNERKSEERIPRRSGNCYILTNGVWSFRWDAENRMVAAYSNDTLLAVNAYDDQSRRIRKVTAQGTRTFLYDGWNPVRETIGVSTNYFCWGTDLSGTMQGAGGVGGLLAVYTVNAGTTSTYYPCYDANGNITAYVDELGDVRAEYAFDAFGQTISQSGDMASTFSHRFSTKYFDPETGLYDYGYRFYSPELGRWVNRDPIEENDGVNLYAFIQNVPTSLIDILGLASCNQCGPDVTTAVDNTLKKVDNAFSEWGESNPSRQRSACEALYSFGDGSAGVSGGGAWDIVKLAEAGKGGRKDIQGTGECKKTVVYKGKCYHVGAVNYVLFGKMNALCRNKFRHKPYYSVTWSYGDMMAAVAFQKAFVYGLSESNYEKGFGYAARQAYDLAALGYADKRMWSHNVNKFLLGKAKNGIPLLSEADTILGSMYGSGCQTSKCDMSGSKPVNYEAFEAKWINISIGSDIKNKE